MYIVYNLNLLKIHKWGVFIEACQDIFFNEIIEYDIMNEEPARFQKKNLNSNYRQNMLPINLDDNKY